GDVKIENTLVFDWNGEDGERSYIIKITDFGHAITKENKPYVGTKHLLAPEVRGSGMIHQRRTIAQNCASDVFSFGLWIWELFLNGKRFFRCMEGASENHPDGFIEQVSEP